MRTKPTAGFKPCATTEVLSGRNGGSCDVCGAPADGIDAKTRRNLCRDCATESDPHGGVTVGELQRLDRQTGGGGA